MASNINKVMVSGNLTRDAEVRITQTGFQIASFGVAVNDRRRNQQTGQYEDYANFVECNLLGARAEKLAPYLLKGTKVAIEGKLHYSSWTDKQTGQKRSKLDVTVDEIEFMSRQGQQGGYQQQPQGQFQVPPAMQQAAQGQPGSQGQQGEYYDVDYPFQELP